MKNPVCVMVGRQIREAREHAGLRQDQLGRKIGVSAQQIAKYESGETMINIVRLARLKDALKIKSLDYFMNEEAAEEADLCQNADVARASDIRCAKMIGQMPDSLRGILRGLVEEVWEPVSFTNSDNEGRKHATSD